jgi:signal transduction histidine kinase
MERILAVDDEPRNLDAIKRALRPLGKVETATSADEAWALFQQQPADMVVSDQRMPGTTGTELLARVAKARPHCGRVLVTAYADMDATVDAINRGRIHCYVRKPYKPQEILKCAQALAEQLDLEREREQLAEELAARNCALQYAIGSLRSDGARPHSLERPEDVLSELKRLDGDYRKAFARIADLTEQLGSQDGNHPAARIVDLAGSAFDETQRLIRLHDRVFQVARRGDVETTLEASAGLDEVVSGIAERVGGEAADAGVEIQLDLGVEALLPLESERFGSALEHLVRNALEAMPEGGVLCLTTRSDGDHAVVSVADTGHGVPAEIRDRVFEPYVTAGKPSANGLGLSLVRRVVEEHAGTVKLEDGAEGGSVFRVRLPLSREIH